jgi:NAD(P)-dependent dehydrogenase (short-subunit alcohol dehydrogenase family)
MNIYNLNKKNVLITGAYGQIGQALIQAFLHSGATVHAADIGPRAPAPLKRRIAKYGKQFFHVQMNVANEASIRAALRGIKRPIDVLINCAGIGIYSPLEKRTEEELDQVIAVNLKGTILVSKLVSAQMAKRKRGSIINIGSIYGVTTPDFRMYGSSGRNSSEIYGATKAGIIHFSRYLAVYLAKRGVRVNTISPGGVLRAQHRSFVKKYADKTPLGRMATTDDLVGAFLFLASDDARYITGENLLVDGGFTLW